VSTKKDAEKNELNSSDVVERAKKRFQLAEDYWRETYKLAEEDLKFRTGDQWPSDIKTRRDQDGKPSLTINKVGPAVRQVTNDQRQNRPSLKFSPVDDLADVETAKIRQGLARHIERRSNADAAYDTAFEQAATGGIGFWRLVTDYCDPLSFDQEILIKRVPNFMSVYLDPSFQEPDGSDANYGFVVIKMSRDEFEAEYPNAELASDDIWGMNADLSDGWVEKEECLVCEYYEKTFEEKELYQLSDGSTLLKEEYDELIAELGGLPPGVDVIGNRKTIWPIIKWYKLTGSEVLEETEIPGEFIPLIPTLGDEYYIDGKRVLSGIVRPAMDPQRMYNYWASSETETIALAPRAPFIGVEGQFEGHEAKWATANTQSHAYLEYKGKDINGQPVGAPQRNVYEPPVQAITNARMLASDDLKSTTGIYDAALGAKSNESSGIAIQRRNAQAQTSNFHLIDNLTRSIRHTGVIINAWIPTYYDGPRVGRIIGEEGEEEIVKLNEEFKHKGKMVTYRMDVGKYDIAVETGPSFATKRQEAAAAMLDLTKSYPNMFPIIGDLMVKSLDIPGAHEMAERLKRVAPPGVIENKDQQPIPPEVQAQMQQMQQMLEQMTQQLNKSQDELDQKTRELESKERIEFSKMQVDLQKKMAELEQKDSALLLQTQVGQIQSMQSQMQQMQAQLQDRLGYLDMDQPIEDENLENEMAFGGPQQAPVMPQDQQPTGGLPPGNNMGV
jgi:Phage P22-like portal protein